MASIVQQVQFVAQLLEALPEQEPGANKERLTRWLANSTLEISFRQLQRYLAELEVAGWAKRTRLGKEDCWTRIHRGTRMLDMSRERAFGLQLIQHKLQHLVPPQILASLSEEFRLASDKLRLHYPSERAWMGKIAEAPPLLRSAPIASHIFPVLTEALLEDKWLKIMYHNRGDKEDRERKVMPLGIVSRESLYYMVARYPDETKNRQFRIDRIKSAQMLDEKFTPPNDFNLNDCLDDGFFNYGSGEEILLVFRMKKAVAYHLYETPLTSDQTIKEVDVDWVEIKVTTIESQKLLWWLLGLGDNVVVKSPSGLVSSVRDTIKSAILYY